ncbi:MAG: hypothetical protein IPH55_17110 [Betaproteobacteria bacterium]|nr:hypothetical protein [Betaproteobacteria bacterium]
MADIIAAAGERGETIIRYNTFAEDARQQWSWSGPALLLGHWPLAGRERRPVSGLWQPVPGQSVRGAAAGRGQRGLYNNVFVNRHGDGVMLREHNDVPRAIDVFGNTVLARGTGVLLQQRRFHCDPETTATRSSRGSWNP